MFDVDTLSDNHCFLCAGILDVDSRSDEHVFPKWLLRKAALWNSNAYLLNGTTLPYRQCVVPCCKSCNSGPLSALESEMKQGFGKGSLNLTNLSLWMGKIYYGIIRRCISLPTDREDSSLGTIVPSKAMCSLSMLRFFLQRIRVNHSFAFEPDSTFVFKLQKYNEPNKDFDWFASTVIGKPGRERFSPGFAIRHNGIGIISVFGDGGVLRSQPSQLWNDFADHTLHPAQFAELTCKAFYQHSLFTDCISYQTATTPDGRMTTLAQFPSHDIFWNEGDEEEYAMCLYNHVRSKPYLKVTTLSDVFPNNQVVTYLYNHDYTPRTFPIEEVR